MKSPSYRFSLFIVNLKRIINFLKIHVFTIFLSFAGRIFKEYWLSVLLGIFAFIGITGGGILLPTYTDWLMAGDPAVNFLGWEFFRYTPLLQWPVGANPNYGLDIGSSIVYSSSIPLLAFLFKPFNAFLPSSFQYFGLWILVCFILQSVFSWKLLSVFSKNKHLLLIGSAFFTIAPPFLWRLHGHYELFSHWTLLFALYLYFSTRVSVVRWACLLGVSALIFPYLFMMVGMIWIADLFQRILKKEVSLKKASIFFAICFFVTIFTMSAAGYFMLDFDVGEYGFGYYRMNLLSLIDSENVWSMVIRDQPGGGGDYEGFNYLGLGMLGLALLAIYEIAHKKIILSLKTVIPLGILFSLLFLIAISNHVAIGSIEFFSYSLPVFIEKIFAPIRASGRFFWPAYYIIYFFIFFVIFSRVKTRVAIIVCLFLLILQIIDSAIIFDGFKKKFSNHVEWSNPLRSPLWNDLAHRYKKIIFVLPHNFAKDWLPLTYFAAKNNLSINIGSFARTNKKKEVLAKYDIIRAIIANRLNEDSLYIFEDDNLWKTAISQINPQDVAGMLDGFRIVAPGLEDCISCNKKEIGNLLKSLPSLVPYTGERIDFTNSGYMSSGWFASESDGMWSDSDIATIYLGEVDDIKKDLVLSFSAIPYVNNKNPFQIVKIYVNNQFLVLLKYDTQNSDTRSVTVPKKYFVGQKKILIEFRFKNATSPSELGMGQDKRHLGLKMIWLQLK